MPQHRRQSFRFRQAAGAKLCSDRTPIGIADTVQIKVLLAGQPDPGLVLLDNVPQPGSEPMLVAEILNSAADNSHTYKPDRRSGLVLPLLVPAKVVNCSEPVQCLWLS